MKIIWMRILAMNGLRMGGCEGPACRGGPDEEVGIPPDWQHVDRGPREGRAHQ